MNRSLISTLTGVRYPFERIEEFADDGESLEVHLPDSKQAQIRQGNTIWERFSDFVPFEKIDTTMSLGEGNTPLLTSPQLAEYVHIDNLLLKNETVNPTWSFKDRGSIACIQMAEEMGEQTVATISTGNMGASIAAYAARAGKKAIIFIPSFCPEEKLRAMAIHGASIFKVDAPDYGIMKKKVLGLASKLGLRIVSGNGPIRVEGYKMIAFEMHEQMKGEVPDFIAVPTSACGHARGLFKGYYELKEAGIIDMLPRMIIVQAKNNSPLVSAWKEGKRQPVPFSDFHTIAEAITTGNPMGGDEILEKAYKYDWLAEDVTEEEILESQKVLAQSGFFVEPASATSLMAVKKLRDAGKITQDATVVLMLTGSGLKDSDVFGYHDLSIHESNIDSIEQDLASELALTETSKFHLSR